MPSILTYKNYFRHVITTNFKINFVHISGLRSEPTMHVLAIQMFVQGFDKHYMFIVNGCINKPMS